ncbi:hypothetical protein AGABI1DRAFT_91089 [Agaricus bisporus var. burnettii JB137-S8]|uniref:F-box domain-containing protein n=1 Tax=Agaricus bisporus var. burnettii (strain JB137-S8 / ATCC MYA-4627 / FGSC 10392) TaxID=597362 RepID=K5X0P7_AGABU|nr:uncharacterized protein AGABI1DRAFT_91089 [Agaricus bisporus var. burnettii JB137-S8]EKM81381.1 hypothetical protein AGABI1DRAFT_91089 [Agaricus bisporus var. burnettii JB137-S8]
MSAFARPNREDLEQNLYDGPLAIDFAPREDHLDWPNKDKPIHFVPLLDLHFGTYIVTDHMESEANSPECDYLRSMTAPYVSASEQAELSHMHERLASLDRHISELNTLRSTIHRRASQLHNQLSLINTLPIEIFSYILQLVVGSKNKNFYSGGCCYRECLRQAFVLSSVSSHFRHVAFGTSELWDRISLQIAEDEVIGNISPLLQHCISCAPKSVSLCIFESRRNEDCRDTRSVIETFITLETTRKVKTLHLHGSTHVWMWIPEFNAASFPMIETLEVSFGHKADASGFDFGTLDTVTRLRIYDAPPTLNFPIIAPPSLQFLEISSVSQTAFLLLLFQCPNLVECYAKIAKDLDDLPFAKPIILNHLKRLRTKNKNAFAVSSFLQHLRLPSLEFFEFNHQVEGSLDIVPFCRGVSATLTTLTILTYSRTLDNDDLYELCRLTFPKLRVLKLNLYHISLLSAIRALSPLDDECNASDLRPLHLPALRSISLYSDVLELGPRTILDLLKNWWSDEELHLRLEFGHYSFGRKDWTPEQREELSGDRKEGKWMNRSQ